MSCIANNGKTNKKKMKTHKSEALQSKGRTDEQ